MKRGISLILTGALSVSLLAGCSTSGGQATPAPGASQNPAATPAPAGSGEATELVIATWGGATSAALTEFVKSFEEANNCTIIIDETAGNSDRLNKLRAQKDAPEIDVAFLTDCFSLMGNDEGLFEKIDTTIVDNLDQLYDFAVSPDGYGPAYSVTCYGIMYNADTVTNPPASYKDLFSDEYAGKVCLPDMAGTAGPMIAVTLAEEMGGSMENVDPAFQYMSEHKDNIAMYYASGSDVVNAFSTGEIDIAVFMDMFVPILNASGVNVKWQNAAEGNFNSMATVNVVKNAPHAELAQKFIKFMMEASTQEQVAKLVNEAPTNKNAVVSDEQAAYLMYGADKVATLKTFDFNYINSVKADWIERFQKEVTTK